MQIALGLGLAGIIKGAGPIYPLLFIGNEAIQQRANYLVLNFVSTFWLFTIGSFGVVMTILTRMHNIAENKALADPLTQVLNRRGLEQHLAMRTKSKRLQNVAIRTGVIALDIDNFKPINDRYGHAEGDLVLIEFAKRVSQALRGNDVIARTGGEEFVVLLADAESLRIDEIGERLRASIEERGFTLSSGELISVTTSVGTTQSSGMDELAISSAIRDADGALYRAKSAGKNRVVRAGSIS